MDYSWKSEYEVGLAEIDAQHRYLFYLLGELHDYAEKAVSDRSARDLLREIDRYTYYHFSSEEVLMEVYRYPGVDQQKHEHFNLLQVLDKKICDYRQQGTTVRPLAEFLYGWFLGHISAEDHRMAAYINETRSSRKGIPKTVRLTIPTRE